MVDFFLCQFAIFVCVSIFDYAVERVISRKPAALVVDGGKPGALRDCD
jgi:hypothetical protein